MKILLVNPKYSICRCLYPPLSLMYLASYVREHGHEPTILDLNFYNTPMSVINDMIGESDMVGITAYTAQITDAKIIGRICKKLGVLSVIGGVHATGVPEETSEYFDVVVRGEGEHIFLDLINGNMSCNGLNYRQNGKIISTPDREFIKDLDTLPMPARDLVPDYRPNDRDFFSSSFTIMLTSRGCPSNCSFCQSSITWRRRVRYRSIENVFKEVEEIYYKYNYRSLVLGDDIFTRKKQRIMDFCDRIINSSIRMEFCCCTTPNTLDKELLKKMKKAGFTRISVGLESSNKILLKRAGKGYFPEDSIKAVNLIKEANISVLVYMIIGLPGEILRTWWRSVMFARKLKSDQFQWTILTPYPATRASREVKVLTKDYSKYGYWRPIIKVGYLTPRMLMIMLRISNFITDRQYNGWGLPKIGIYLVWRAIKKMFRFLKGKDDATN